MKNVFLLNILSLIVVFNGFCQSGRIDLVSKLSFPGLPIHDVWGYIDSASGNSYALLCASTSGLRIIDVTDPSNPALVGSISGNGVQAIDVKTWKNFAYVVAESASISGKIIDISDPSNPVKVGNFPWGHNISISDSGYLYLSTPGFRIFDIKTDPLNPILVYTDNSCDGHDISIKGLTMYDFSGNCGSRIFDIKKADTVNFLGSIPSSGIFHHSGWPSEDGKFLFICDELASPSENDISVWDISDLSNPFIIDSFSDPNAYVHNIYVHGNFAFVSYYRAGFRVFDISDPTNFTLLTEYDTDSNLTGPGYGGNFGLYTLWGNDIILASDEENGLYIFKFTSSPIGISKLSDKNENNLFLFPNPATNEVLLNYWVMDDQYPVNIEVWSIEGRQIKSIEEGFKIRGRNELKLSISDFDSGNYIIKVRNGIQESSVILLIAN